MDAVPDANGALGSNIAVTTEAGTLMLLRLLQGASERSSGLSEVLRHDPSGWY
jgi:hypothetical protein